MNFQNLTKWMRRLGATLVFLLLAINQVHAIPITIPSGLNPGDQYRLVFVTSRAIGADAVDINVYNDFVSTIANSVPELSDLSTSWTAIASTQIVNARVNTGTDGLPGVVPVYNTSAHLVATDYGDLWDGAISGNMWSNEFGDFFPGLVWTGTLSDGLSAGPAALGGASAVAGNSAFVGAQWVNTGVFSTGAGLELSLYAMSGVLAAPAAPVPEPATILLIGSGLVALAGYRRKNRKA